MKLATAGALIGFGLVLASLSGILPACSSPPSSADASGGAANNSGAGAGSESGGGGTVSTGGAGGTAGTGSAPGTGSASGAGGSGGEPPIVDCSLAGSVPVSVSWSSINSQPPSFYATAEALTLAENILYYQNDDHGWPKDTDMTTTTAQRSRSTIDNRATTTQIEYLARVYTATRCAAYGDAVLEAVQYLLDGQYPNGGWPQEFPNPEGYHAHITFNDDAIVHVLELLQAVSRKQAPYAFVSDELAAGAGAAVVEGIQCILDCQVVTAGMRTGWCAQHDEVTLEPAQARTYELPSLSGSEAVGLVRFLMSIDQPSAEIRAAIEGAIAWFDSVKITGIRVEAVTDASQPTGEDRIVVDDPSAPPIWARFYELGTNRPIFSSRCEVPECDDDPFFLRRYSLAEIDNERRVGYAWYGDWPADLLAIDYPAWRQKWPAE